MKRAIPILALIAASTTAVVAFPRNKAWHEASFGVSGVNRAGAGGVYGTGSRADHGIKCSHCHVKSSTVTNSITVSVAATPAFAVVGASTKYVPGTTYAITVSLVGEHLGAGPNNDLSNTANKNGMVLTIENANGQRAGRFVADAGQDTNACPVADPYPGYPGVVSPVTKTTFMYGDCHGVLPLDRPLLTSWTFTWYAPAAGAGDLTIFVGAVDGNGASSTNDDVAERAISLKEGP